MIGASWAYGCQQNPGSYTLDPEVKCVIGMRSAAASAWRVQERFYKKTNYQARKHINSAYKQIKMHIDQHKPIENQLDTAENHANSCQMFEFLKSNKII